ncbi:hypothetical protein Y1Q_0010007 [Alligator mississippiensis]|uniref:Uncharacterized protein n=1 Tax=Alligator mississippiensis TaxID=8496 RepID=A0A151MLH2_ALLMI|nr:hypothetical protein Y1Q_0010007 [Alligator mississippiensis]
MRSPSLRGFTALRLQDYGSCDLPVLRVLLFHAKGYRYLQVHEENISSFSNEPEGNFAEYRRLWEMNEMQKVWGTRSDNACGKRFC